MLIKMVLALADEEKEKALEQEFAMTDIEVERVGHYPDAWQRVVQSCADIIVICEAVFVGPVESGLALLSVLPEGPATVMLHDDNSTDIQASYIAAGAHSALYSGISKKKLIGALEATIETRRQLMHLEWNDRRKGQKPKLSDFSTSR